MHQKLALISSNPLKATEMGEEQLKAELEK